MQAIRVLIVAPDPLARAGLANWLATDELCQIAGLADATSEWIEDIPLFRPDVVLYDAGWQGSGDWLDLGDVEAPVVALVVDEEGAAEAWAAGARGVLGRDNSAETILSALMAAAHNLITIQPDWLPTVAPSGLGGDALRLTEPLTPREVAVLRLLAQGLTNKAIAHDLGISEHTVKFHVNALLGKLGAQSRTEAAVRAARLGLLPV